MRQVEEVVIGALIDPRAACRSGWAAWTAIPGVWIDPSSTGRAPAGPRKVAAIGVRTAHGRTTHGFALNVSPDLAMFAHIVPCGIADRPVTSLAAEGFDVTMGGAVDAVLEAAAEVWGAPTMWRR